MYRIKCTLSYDGSKFFGYQKQPNKRTVQGELELAIKTIYKKNIKVHSSGRTDAKVHALVQVIHFDVDNYIDSSKIKFALNGFLPLDIYIKEVVYVDENFHSRYSNKEKTYLYRIKKGERNPLETNYFLFLKHEINVEKMIKAIKYFIGEHDFSSFGTKLKNENNIRIIYDAFIKYDENNIDIYFIGSGFLRYQVRTMVGSLIDIGRSKFEPENILDILKQKNRQKAGKKADAQGLYLFDIKYI